MTRMTYEDNLSGRIESERIDLLAEWLEATIGPRLTAFATATTPTEVGRIAHGDEDPPGAAGISDRCDRVPLLGPVALLRRGQPEPAGQLRAQVLGLDHGVNDQLRGQMQDVDLLGVLAP